MRKYLKMKGMVTLSVITIMVEGCDVQEYLLLYYSGGVFIVRVCI
jgi:hypothetical protein